MLIAADKKSFLAEGGVLFNGSSGDVHVLIKVGLLMVYRCLFCRQVHKSLLLLLHESFNASFQIVDGTVGKFNVFIDRRRGHLNRIDSS